MASTRNINTRCNYELEQKSNRMNVDHNLYKNGPSGVAYKNEFPEFYYRPSQLPRQFYTENSIDIESTLRGINSTDLVNGPPVVTPIFKPITFNCFFEHSNKVILPEPLVIEKDQRPKFN
tara:strand:+ start:179 stop:538 length:360 start_codon:yes stop_codon:yes gene_type:complete